MSRRLRWLALLVLKISLTISVLVFLVDLIFPPRDILNAFLKSSVVGVTSSILSAIYVAYEEVRLRKGGGDSQAETKRADDNGRDVE